MKVVIFGLSVSSSWGNGHATIWRGLIAALTKSNYEIVFFEKNVSYYADNRDYLSCKGLTLILYDTWESIVKKAEFHIKKSDIAIVTSYCPDAVSASELITISNGLKKIFYDLDTPVTFKSIENGNWPFYIPQNGLRNFDIVLSYTGGPILEKLKQTLGAKAAFPLYGSADPQLHYPTCKLDKYKCDLSYLGTFASDRQEKLEELFVKPAQILKDKRFLLAGAQYPEEFPWTENILFISHIAPPEHSCFYCSSLFTLNVTRSAMAEMGYCASGRLFEAALCQIPILSDWWPGLESFFNPGEEIIVVKNTSDVIDAFNMTENKRIAVAKAARKRVLREHTAEKRAQQLMDILNSF